MANKALLCKAFLCLQLVSLLANTLAFDLNLTPSEDDESNSVNVPEEQLEPESAPSQPLQDSRENKSNFGRLFNSIRRGAASALKKMPKYFDFDSYKKRFDRKYSPEEFFFRKAMFLKRCFEVFQSRVRERLGKASYVQDVNKFSDRSPNEIKRMFMSGPPIELRPEGQSEREYYRELEESYKERELWDAELESRASFDDLSSAFGASTNNNNQEADMISVHESQIRSRIESQLRETMDEDLKSAILDELEGRPSETESQMCLSDVNRPPRPPHKELPWPGAARRSKVIDLNEPASGAEYKPPNLSPDSDYLDWSEHKCFHTVYDQKDKCGKCYVMATTAIAEFFKCTEEPDKIQPRKFSKEYVLDCAVKYKPGAIYGCKGGSMLETARFIATAGAFNIRGWKERLQRELRRLKSESGFISELDEKCPLNEFETSYDKWGDVRVQMDPAPVPVNDWFEALQDGPLVASVQMPNGVESYKSGVHDGADCESSQNWHTMILVGYGLDDRGVAYWRFRNSFGPDWGDAGHFNLAMAVPSKCLVGGVRIYRQPMSVE